MEHTRTHAHTPHTHKLTHTDKRVDKLDSAAVLAFTFVPALLVCFLFLFLVPPSVCLFHGGPFGGAKLRTARLHPVQPETGLAEVASILYTVQQLVKVGQGCPGPKIDREALAVRSRAQED